MNGGVVVIYRYLIYYKNKKNKCVDGQDQGRGKCICSIILLHTKIDTNN